jgi:hypothetical protein
MTLKGLYRVRAQKAGCHAPGSPVAYVETATMTIPPAVTDIDLVLEGRQAQGPLKERRWCDTVAPLWERPSRLSHPARR